MVPGRSDIRTTMVDVEGQLFYEIADKRITRDDVALTYAFGIRQGDPIDWPKVNKAIIERWSMSALKYIKTEAWAYAEGRHL